MAPLGNGCVPTAGLGCSVWRSCYHDGVGQGLAARQAGSVLRWNMAVLGICSNGNSTKKQFTLVVAELLWHQC